MTWHHTDAHMDHPQSWDILTCRRQTSTGQLADLPHSNHTVALGKVSTSPGRDKTLVGSPRCRAGSRGMTTFRQPGFMPGLVWSLVLLSSLSVPSHLPELISNTSDRFPCLACPHFVPADPSCSFPFQSLPFSPPTPMSCVPSLLIKSVSVPPGSSSALLFYPT